MKLLSLVLIVLCFALPAQAQTEIMSRTFFTDVNQVAVVLWQNTADTTCTEAETNAKFDAIIEQRLALVDSSFDIEAACEIDVLKVIFVNY